MTTYKYRTKPYQHQVKGLKWLLAHDGGALLMEPRTGKTKVTIDWLSVLNQQGKITQAIVVCPARVMGTWLLEFLAHSPRRVHLTVYDRDERKRGIPPKPPGYDLHVIIVNFDAFATPGPKTASGRRSRAAGRFKLRTNLRKWMGTASTAGVVDESHKLKNPSGKAANMIVSMRDDFAYRAILTGTPMTKARRAHDIYMQWQFLNPERFKDIPRAEDFKTFYGRWLKKDGYDQYIGPRNLSDLHKRISKDSYIIRRDQCFDLPAREDRVITVKLSDRTRRVYDQMAEKMIALIEEDKSVAASIKLVQSLRLSQITSGFVGGVNDEDDRQRLSFEKFEALKELLVDEFDRDQKVVIAARWRDDLDLIEDLVETLGASCWSIRGGRKRHETDQAILDFRAHDGPGAMVIQPSAASLGIDLSTAAHMIWYSHCYSWVDFTQACDRIALSRNSTTFSHIVALNTVDEMVLHTLATDGDIGKAIMSRPDELLNGHPLNLDDHKMLQGVGTFQYKKGKR